MKGIKISGRVIGEGLPSFIIAEAGVNHNGDVRIARKLVDVACVAGADAIKFQTFSAEDLVTPSAQKANYQKKITDAAETQYEMLKRLELSNVDFKEISDYCKKKGIIFLSTPYDCESADFLYELGIPAYKIGSSDVTNAPLLHHISLKGKPIILSSGMTTIQELSEAIDIIKNTGLSDIIVLHCVTSYPAEPSDLNIRVIDSLRKRFGLPVGLSDHTLSTVIPAAAVAIGAVLIEKHFTIDRSMNGPDHKASLDPDELKIMIKNIREVEASLGDGIKKLTLEEIKISKIARKSIVAKVDIPTGSILTNDMLTIKRPGTGIKPKHIKSLIGKRTIKDIKKNEVIFWESIK